MKSLSFSLLRVSALLKPLTLALTTLAQAASFGSGFTYPGHLADAGQRFV